MTTTITGRPRPVRAPSPRGLKTREAEARALTVRDREVEAGGRVGPPGPRPPCGSTERSFWVDSAAQGY